MPEVTLVRSEIDRRLDEFDVARRALRWILEHRVYWDRRTLALREPTALNGPLPFVQPPDEVLVYIHSILVEIDLEAESAG